MGIGDKIKHKAEEMSGKVKESAGDATDNRDLEAESGRADRPNVKQAGDNVPDALREAARRRQAPPRADFGGWGVRQAAAYPSQAVKGDDNR